MDKVIIGLDKPAVQNAVLDIPSDERHWFGLKKHCAQRDFENHYFYSDNFVEDNCELLASVSIPQSLEDIFYQKLSVYLNQFSRSRFGRDRLASENEVYLWLVLKWVYNKFNQCDIKWFFSDAPPHFGFDEIISDFMRWKNVPVYYGCQTLIPDRFVVVDHNMEFVAPAEENKFYPMPEVEGEVIFYMKHVDYYRPKKRKHLGWKAKQLLGINKDTPLWTDSRIELGQRYFKNLNRSFELNPGLEKLKDAMGKPFVYFALHMQPEMTTSALGDEFVDQILAIEHLARRLPEGWKIIVKENPKQDFRHRDYAFFERLLKIPEVVLADRRTSTRYLIQESAIVATVSGTVGWEAARLLKPVIIFGWAWYQKLSGVYKYHTDMDLQNVLEQPLTREALDKSYQHMLEFFWKGCVDTDYFEIMSEQEISESCDSIKSLIKQIDGRS